MNSTLKFNSELLLYHLALLSTHHLDSNIELLVFKEYVIVFDIPETFIIIA